MKKYIFIFFVIIGFLIVKENIKKATGIYNHFYNIMRRCAIITYKDGIYELPHKLPKDLRLRILRNKEILVKCLKFVELYVNTSKELPKNRN